MVRQLLLLISLSVAAAGSDVIGTYGNSVTIDCNLPLSDNLVWDSTDGNFIAIKGRPVVRNSTKYAIERQNGVRESLVIHQLTLADDKVYRCYDLRQTDIKELSTVMVLVRPHHMNMTSPTGPINEGSEVSLLCQAGGGKPLPDIRWYMIDASGDVTEMIGDTNDVMYSNGTGRRTNTLIFNVTRNHYNATFVCNVTVSVFFEETFAAALDVQLLPCPPIISGFDGVFDENQTVHVACTSSGSKPTANAMWFLNGMPVGDFEVVVIPEADGTSTVTSYFRRRLSTAMNGTVLTCAVTNNVLTDLNLESVRTNVTLLISYRPNITVESNAVITATSGDFVTLRFAIDSRPAPYSLSLLHNGVTVDRSLYRIEHRNDSKRYDVIIPKVSRSFAGNYSLSATNRLGTNVSTAVQLKIMYVPQCSSSVIQKQAMHVNNSVRLLCRMFASPIDVTMTWKYRHTGTVIGIISATKDNSSKEQVFGDVEFDARSLLQYTDTFIECYGTNSVGESTEPCVFQLVHPGPPEAPSNCSISRLYTGAYFNCQPSFDGGSTQAFSLQRLIGTDYQTVFNQSTSEFNLWTYGLVGNVTIRMCSVNREYPDQFSCTPMFEADVDGVLSEPTRAEEVNTAAFIAGGLVGFIGLLCISSIIIFILRKKQKNIHSRPDHSSQEMQKGCAISVSRIRERVLGCILKARDKETNNTEPEHRRPSNGNNAEVQELKVISSTPCFAKQHRINVIHEDAVEMLKKFESFKTRRLSGIKSDVCMAVTYANGVILSPIVKHHEDDEDTSITETFETQDTQNENITDYEKNTVMVTINKDTLEINYSKVDIADVLDEQTLAESYSRSDIADVLDTMNTTEMCTAVLDMEETPTDINTLLPDPELSVNGTLTLNLDYSAADIVSVLDKIDSEKEARNTYTNSDLDYSAADFVSVLDKIDSEKEALNTSANSDVHYSAADFVSILDKIDSEKEARNTSMNTDSDVRVVPDYTCVEIVDETTLSLFSECDTALGLSRTFSFMSNLRNSKPYLTHSASSPDLTRSDVLLSDVSSKSCCSLHNMSGEKLTVRRLSESDIEKECSTSLDSCRIDKLQTKVSFHRSLEIVCDSLDDYVTESVNECVISSDKDTCTKEETTIW